MCGCTVHRGESTDWKSEVLGSGLTVSSVTTVTALDGFGPTYSHLSCEGSGPKPPFLTVFLRVLVPLAAPLSSAVPPFPLIRWVRLFRQGTVCWLGREEEEVPLKK